MQSLTIKGSRSSTQCCGAEPWGSPFSLLCRFSPAPVHFSSTLLTLFSLFSAVGCAVGPWGPWSSCSSPCGVGSKDRSRQVTVPPRHGGEPCPDLKQRRGCLGDDPACGAAKGVAKLLPDSFSPDIRDPWRRTGMQRSEEPPSSHLPISCSFFRLTQVAAACRGQPWSRRLQRDRQVCVECWGDTVHGHPRCDGYGVQGARTFWVATSIAGCQGSWVREALQEGCACPPPAFIFV
uniref:Somatomedin-B and thrombospondin type-1 domain-containing protein-like n=1 Tax=Coturnix japonica TaxID=93934 RepID=A0A8C2TD36_COTJA